VADHPALLFANDAFYVAFASRDLAAMNEIWSERPGVTCIHPGWKPLIGRRTVMESWLAILGNPASPRISCHRPQATILGDVGYVVCFEKLEDGFLVASNIFIREGGLWKMLHHHAGVSPPPTEQADEPVPFLQ
jgi:hypothetical protein